MIKLIEKEDVVFPDYWPKKCPHCGDTKSIRYSYHNVGKVLLLTACKCLGCGTSIKREDTDERLVGKP